MAGQMSKKQELLARLYSLHRFGIKPGLERTLRLLEQAGNPHLKLKAVHVAGTNGKGSVCSTVASVLTEAGFKTGLYTSPHIIDFNERIRVDGVMISDDNLARIIEPMLDYAEGHEATFFEITTALAFKYFAEAGCDAAVIETGMGGRFDSTNVLEPLVTVITKIDIDHTEYLGDTIEKIAFEKGGIIKNNTPAVVARNDSAALEVLRECARSRGAGFIYAPDRMELEVTDYGRDLSMTAKISSGSRGREWFPAQAKLALAGPHQADNAGAALCALEQLKSHFSITGRDIERGLARVPENTGLRARMSLLRDGPALIIDVAHNPAAVQIFMDTIDKCGYGGTSWDIVFGAMADKDVSGMLDILKPRASKFFFAAPAIERAMTTRALAGLASDKGIAAFELFNGCRDAIRGALAGGRPILALGSFYLIGEIIPELQLLLNKERV